MRIKENAEGDLDEAQRNLLYAVIWPERQGCEATAGFGLAILLILFVPLSYANYVQ